MNDDKPVPDRRRKHPVHGVRVPPAASEPPIVYVTVCTRGRQPWLAAEKPHDLLRDLWSNGDRWRVGRYVLMPDHLHVFAAWIDPATSLEAWVRFWKTQFRKQVGDDACRWQSGHWDTRMRNAAAQAQKWSYVEANPIRAGLVQHAGDWPFWGVLNDLS